MREYAMNLEKFGLEGKETGLAIPLLLKLFPSLFLITALDPHLNYSILISLTEIFLHLLQAYYFF